MNTKHIIIVICLLLGLAQAEDFIKKIFGSNPFAKSKSFTYHFGKDKTATEDSDATTTKKARTVGFKFGKSKKVRTTTSSEESQPTETPEPTTTTEESSEPKE